MSLKEKLLVLLTIEWNADIYDGKLGDIVNAWIDAWDE
jgi:hypothetical protein